MASYSKQMMDVAKEWLAANPDPKSPFLKVPGLDRDKRHTDLAKKLAHYERIARERPEIRDLVEDLRRAIPEAETQRKELHALEDDLERLLNTSPEPGHQKRDRDDELNSDLGRWCLAWARHGYNTIELTPDFTAAMLLTDARELDIEEVRLPFNGILMLIPDGFARGVEGTSYTKIHISEIPRDDLAQLDVGEKLYDIMDKLPPASVQKVIAATEAKIAASPPSLLTKIVRDPKDTVIHIYATDGAHVLDTIIERKGLSWAAFDDLPDSVADADDQRACHTLRQIVFGTLAYMGAVPTAAEQVIFAGPPPKKRGALEPFMVRWTVGRTITIGPELVRSVRAGAREIAFRLKCRHIVRGHYRNQAHGAGMLDRKRIWILPFWKGPEAGAELVHTYKLTDAKETT